MRSLWTPVALGWAMAWSLVLLMGSPADAVGQETWKAGVARRKITPERTMWMSGYAGRDRPADSTLIDLYAKAIAVEDPAGERVVLVGLDLVGIDRDLSVAICKRLEAEHRLKRSQVALCSSHTHTGPVVGRNLMTMYTLDAAQNQLVQDYTRDLEQHVVAVVAEALADLAPANLAWGSGHNTLAVNRRANPEGEVPAIRAAGKLKGPVDYDVPVLTARRPDGRLVGILFGYACHATVLPIFRWSGDWPGYAQLALEETHQGATAIFFAGCGADQNPLPRRMANPPTPQAQEEFGISRASEYGGSIARSVTQVVAGHMHEITGKLRSEYREIPLALDKLPTREEIAKEAESTNKYAVSRAKVLLKQLEQQGALSQTYPYPVQLWQLGPQLQLVTLGGEVVVDFAVRLKRELSGTNTFVAAYTNDVMAYIPSLRVLKEGGYEGGGAMLYYGLPTTWSPAVEESIVRGVHELLATPKP
ncbi:MAG: neutral/alkaline non-lysosomal ceramidase N-terminal domain-containing protein [Planctomycetaceae bacterium]